MILYFRNEHKFLSNFYPTTVMYDGYYYPSSEHAYQAAKSMNLTFRAHLTTEVPTCQEAKEYGRKLALRPGWDAAKVDIMLSIVLDKFTRNPSIRAQLAATGTQDLIECNTWGDRFWGCELTESGKLIGENHLGQILVNVRRELHCNV